MPRPGDFVRAGDVSVQACRVTRTVVQSIAAGGTGTVVAFDAEVFDTDGMHSTSVNNSRITFNTAGFYIVGFNGTFASQAAGVYTRTFAEVRLNGSTSLGRLGSDATAVTKAPELAVVTMFQFSAADYVELLVFQQSGGVKDLEVTVDRSPEFWAARIGS